MLSLGGPLLICDFFKLDVPMKSIMGGGHSWIAFKETIEKAKLDLISDEDITEGTPEGAAQRWEAARCCRRALDVRRLMTSTCTSVRCRI